MKLRRLIYTSQATKKLSNLALLDLLHDSRSYNKIDNITGILMHSNGYFLQVIEGRPDVIEHLVDRLLKDSRHIKFKIILDCSVNSRLFPNWNMSCADFDNPELSLIPGIRTDLNDAKVIKDLIKSLPEIADFLLEKLNNSGTSNT
jgi:hypothetical protein